MSETNVLRQEWRTPGDFYAVIEAEFHPQVDVAASAENTKCRMFYSEEVDALGNWPWLGATVVERDGKLVPEPIKVAWCNPGFNNMLPWLLKAREQADRYQGTVLVLGLLAPSTDWWRKGALLADEIRLVGGKRIQFDPAPGIPRSSNARENALFIFRGRSTFRIQNPCPTHIWTWYWNEPRSGA